MFTAATTTLAGDHKHAELGEKAPAFTLTDATGTERNLADYKGMIVVLEWINPDCPWVEKCYKREAMQGAYEAVKELDKDAVWLAINTTHYTGADQNNVWVKKYKLEYPILLDTDGAVGHLYEAKRTPHMFVIDKEGTLRYHGAIDNNKGSDKVDDDVTTYVVEAVSQLVAGETVAPDYVKPYGCSVKYKK
jgi:peroxiredoxin